jgi:hypothetical protein
MKGDLIVAFLPYCRRYAAVTLEDIIITPFLPYCRRYAAVIRGDLMLPLFYHIVAAMRLKINENLKDSQNKPHSGGNMVESSSNFFIQ